MSEWIVASERKPEDNRDVLFIWRDADSDPSAMVGYWNGMSWFTVMGIVSPQDVITHWMPLPCMPGGKS